MSQAKDLVRNIEKLKTLRTVLTKLIERKVRTVTINLRHSTVEYQSNSYSSEASAFSEDYLIATEGLLRALIQKLEDQIPFTIVEDPPLKKVARKKVHFDDTEEELLEYEEDVEFEDDDERVDEDDEDFEDDTDDDDSDFP